MKRVVTVLFVLIVSSMVVAAQAPKGWRLRVDQSASASDPDAAGSIKFTQIASGFQTVNPRAAVFWNPANTASGNYTLKGTFTLVEPSPHVNYYGLVFGGGDLEGAMQHYLYFMVAQDGTFLIKRRNREATQELTTNTPNRAIKQPDASGKSTNTLEVRVMANSVEFVVNGTVVHMMPKNGAMARTDGIYGFRVNHLLEVQVQGLAVSPS
jgi:hypothetical protein